MMVEGAGQVNMGVGVVGGGHVGAMAAVGGSSVSVAVPGVSSSSIMHPVTIN